MTFSSVPSFALLNDGLSGNQSNMSRINGQLIDSAQIDLNQEEGEIYYETYTVRKDIALPIVGAYNEATGQMDNVTGVVNLKGSNLDGEQADEIRVLEEIKSENGNLVRIGIDSASNEEGLSDVLITEADLELLVNSNQDLVTAVEQDIDAEQIATVQEARRGRGGHRSKRIRSSGRRSTRHAVHGGRRHARRGGSGGWSGRCYAQVKTWLLANGLVKHYLPGVAAKNAGPTLLANGFHSVGRNAAPKKGRVCVYGTTGGRVSRAGRIYGHIEVFDGSRWAGSGWRSYAFVNTGRVLKDCYEK
jgi:hypothetical protein